MSEKTFTETHSYMEGLNFLGYTWDFVPLLAVLFYGPNTPSKTTHAKEKNHISII